MGIRDFAKRWFTGTGPNVRWDITKYAFGALLAFLVATAAAGVFAVTALMRALGGLSINAQSTVLSILVIAWVIAIACVIWAVMTRNAAETRVRTGIDTAIEVTKAAMEMWLEERKSESTAPPVLEPAKLEPATLTPPTPPSQLAQIIRRAPGYEDVLKNIMREQAARPPLPHKEQGDVNLRIEIQEVLFLQTGGYLMMGGMKEFVLMRLSVTNVGHDEPTAKAWKLTVQIGYEYKDETEKINSLPGGWMVRRRGQLNTTTDEPPAPDLVALSRTEEFKFGKQRLGWVAFEFYRDGDAVPPYNAMYSVSITDSLGNIHVGTLEPTRYIPKGEIC